MDEKTCFDKKIIVIDDMVAMRNELLIILKEIGFNNVETAVDGKDAWEKIRDQAFFGAPYELIITDIHMPLMNGMTLLKNIRNVEVYKKTPIVMISTENEKGVIIKAISEGATSYILKPFDPLLVKERLITVLLD